MNIKGFTIELRNQTSDGGTVVLSDGNAGEVAINIVGGRTPGRRDCRIDIEQLIKAVKILQAGVLPL